MRYGLTSCVAALGLLALAGEAQASVVTASLNIPDPSAGLPAGTLGTITLIDFGSGATAGVTVDVSLITGVNFVNTGGPHTPFVYDLSATPSSIVFPMGSPFSAAGSSSATPFGTFNHGVDMTGGNGAAGSKHGPSILRSTASRQRILSLARAGISSRQTSFFFPVERRAP
jgi:hypothetical protein